MAAVSEERARSAANRAPEGRVRAEHVMTSAGTIAPERTEEVVVDESEDTDRSWVTIVWNDPVNLMNYVTYVFQKLFNYDEPTATKLMLQVHHEGRAIVSSGAKERMESDTSRLHSYGLWASYQRDS